MKLVAELKHRNPILFWFGFFNILVGVICLVLISLDEFQILGVSRWLKPMKFYFSVGLMIITMGWILHYLNDTDKIKKYSWWLVITMFFENGLIVLQAIRKTTSHFNNRTGFDVLIFQLMGIFILLFTITFIRIAISFFRQKEFSVSIPYKWGIRLGILFFILFSLEGGVMLTLMKHTVGAADGTAGIPVFNWSKQYGDLRIAHFLGIHALQVLPLAGFYISKTKNQIIIISLGWFLITAALLIKALYSSPLFLLTAGL